MNDLDRIVDVTIKREGGGVASANFSTPMFVTKTATARVATFTSPQEVLDVGYTETSDEYLASVAHFTQENYPAEFKIGQWGSGGGETLTQALTAIVEADNEFYGVATADILTGVEVVELYDKVLEFGKFLFAVDNDQTVPVAVALNTNDSSKSTVYYSSIARTIANKTAYGDVAYMSRILGLTVGSYTAVNKNLTGMITDKLNTTDVNVILDANASYYNTVYQEDITVGGKVCDGTASGGGEWLDVEIGLDWLKVRIQESVFSTIIQADKIPYTDEGTKSIANSVASVLNTAKNNGLITEDYKVTTVPVSDVDDADKVARKYDGVSFTATLTGAIHTTSINGIVRY